MAKVFLNVTAEHNAFGITKPISIKWEDGRVFSIDRILDVRQAAALKAGGCGMRYRCRVMGKEIDLFCEEDKWYIDK